jgi:transposase
MDKKTTTQPRDWREARRQRAWELKRKGWKQKDIAEALGVSDGAVSQWLKRGREGGVEALRSNPAPGPTPKLSGEQLEKLPRLLAKGAKHFGFREDIWTQPRVAWLIQREFGVRYHPAHVGRILKRLGWSRQKPVERASQRNEEAIERWRTEKWEELKKKPKKKDEP